MRQNLFDSNLERPQVINGFRMLPTHITATATVTVDEDMGPLINLDTNGAARNLDFPAPSSSNEGMMWIVNHAGSTAVDITVRNSAAATILTLSQNEAGIVFIANGVTYGRLFGALT